MTSKLFSKTIIFLTLLSVILSAHLVQARVYLDITQAELQKLPVAVPSFVDKASPNIPSDKGRAMAELMGKALTLHGFISVVNPALPHSASILDWKNGGADLVVLANYTTDQGRLVMELRCIDTNADQMLVGKKYRTSWEKSSSLIRKFADEIIMKLSNESGISNTQIAFVSDISGSKEVYVADILGEKIRQVTRHKKITVSPRFSPDGGRLAYTSYHRGNPNLYITDLSQSKTTKAVSWQEGLNVAPAWALDSKSMIITLSKDGNPDLYQMTIDGKVQKRLTKNEGINVSPSMAPDGKRFAFVSDRTGKPQIYIMDLASKRVDRLTHHGTENTTPSWSPKGDLIAYTGRADGNYHIFLISPEGGSPVQLTQYWGDHESPSWSPDGKQLVFSRNRSGKHQLCTVFLKGSGVIPLFESHKGNQTFPQWSPRLQY